jgi:hypothetical protein
MALALTLRYASFRHKNKSSGRFLELTVIACAMMAIGVLLTTDSIQLMLVSLAVVFSCSGLFWFFKKCDDIRRSMPD